MNTCLINPNIIFYYSCSLHIYKYTEYHKNQYCHTQLESHTNINLVQFALYPQLKNLLKYFSKTLDNQLIQNFLL